MPRKQQKAKDYNLNLELLHAKQIHLLRKLIKGKKFTKKEKHQNTFPATPISLWCKKQIAKNFHASFCPGMDL